MLDYVRAVSSQAGVFYVGHSMGTTSLMVLLAARPQYNSAIRAAFLMAPIVYFDHAQGALAAARDTVGPNLVVCQYPAGHARARLLLDMA